MQEETRTIHHEQNTKDQLANYSQLPIFTPCTNNCRRSFYVRVVQDPNPVKIHWTGCVSPLLKSNKSVHDVNHNTKKETVAVQTVVLLHLAIGNYIDELTAQSKTSISVYLLKMEVPIIIRTKLLPSKVVRYYLKLQVARSAFEQNRSIVSLLLFVGKSSF